MKARVFLSFILVCLIPQLVSAAPEKVGEIIVEGNYKYLVGKLPDGKTKKLEVADELETQLGVLRTVFDRVSYGLEFFLFLDEKRIKSGASDIYGIYYIGQQPWVLIGSHPGGKNPNDLSFLKIYMDKTSTEIKYKQPSVFVSYKNKLDVESEDNRLVVDLGFEDQKRKLAILENEQISIEYKEVKLSAVSSDDCRKLYEHAKKECTLESRRKDCMNMIASKFIYVTNLYHLANTPGYKQDGFNNECYEACKSGVMSEYEAFSKSTCGYN